MNQKPKTEALCLTMMYNVGVNNFEKEEKRNADRMMYERQA
jgi:hypothetical protein